MTSRLIQLPLGGCFLLAFLCVPQGTAASSSSYEPTSDYEVRRIEGWTVLVNRPFLEGDPELARQTLTVLEDHLRWIVRVVPRDPLARLREIRIWVEKEEPHHPCMAYHPNAGWLTEHGMNPDKARCVEVANANNFLTWTIDQPCMVLHELAHGYHHQFLDGGYENAQIREAFRNATTSGLYDNVLHLNGREQKAYAATNPMEYFAEATEAYFGTNDFFPFVKPELKRLDPRLYELLETLWGQEAKSEHEHAHGHASA